MFTFWSNRVVCKLVGLLAGCCIIEAAAAADFTGGGNYAISLWRSEQGLPQNFIKSVLQSRDGYLWLATFNGLARFDGVRVTVFDVSNTPELKNNLINRIFEDSKGRLWIGHDTGDVAIYFDGQFSRLATPVEWSVAPIDSFAEDASGRVWILNRNGWLLPVNNLQPETILKPERSGDFLIRDNEGQIWIHKTLPGGRCLFQTISSSAPESTPSLAGSARAFASRKGGLWVAEKDRLRRWQNGRWQEERPPFPPLDMFHPALLETHDGRLLAGCFKDGLYILESDGKVTHLTTATGLAHNWVYCLSEDREGNVWVGTGGGGLNMLRPQRVEMLNLPDDWQGRSVLSATPAADGGLWIATEGSGIYRWQVGQARPVKQTAALPASVFWSVLETSNQTVWLGSWGEGLLQLSNNVVLTPPEMPGISRAVVCLYADRSERVWVGTTAGLGCLAAGKWTKLEAGSTLPKPDVRCLTESSDGSIWFGTMGSGLYRLQDGKTTHFGTSNGLASDYIWSLWSAPDGALWVGTFGGGLSRFKNGKFAAVTKKNGLPSNVICHIEPDDNGDLWMSSYAGIFRISTRALNECADGTSATINCLVYDRSDGLSTREMAGGCQPSGCRMNDGRLCFATRAGLAIVDPARATPNLLLPPVKIEEFLVDGKPVQLPGHLGEVTNAMRTSLESGMEKIKLPPGERRVEVRFTGLSFAAPQRVRFRYRMNGLDKDWIDADTRRSVDYSYLPPGDYLFNVIACNSDGAWNTNGASLAFTVLPHFWQTWWFAVSCWLAGTSVVAGGGLTVARRRHRRKLDLLERQQALERERSRIARDIHDELGASLTRITMFSQSAQAKTKTGQTPIHEVNTIFTTARNITRSMDEIVWAINPKHDTLGSLEAYLANYVEEFLEPTSIRFELNFPLSHPDWPISAEVRHDLFLAFREALNNIVKHAAATKITVSLEMHNRQLILCVCDDGLGFDRLLLEAQRDKTGRPFRGNGLENMQKRLREISGTCEVESAPGQGTRIRFNVQLHE